MRWIVSIVAALSLVVIPVSQAGTPSKPSWIKTYDQWVYHYSWQTWLPAKWQRVGACETGYGKRPGNWTWNSGPFQGAFGFAVSSWDAFRGRADPKAGPYPSEAYLATPRQQYEVALAIYRQYGFSGWGCRGA